MVKSVDSAGVAVFVQMVNDAVNMPTPLGITIAMLIPTGSASLGAHDGT